MKNNTVLLAEDDPNFGSVLRDYLELNDFDVVLATDGIEALRIFKAQESFDLCILDVMMPHKDGFTLAADIRKIDKEVPLIFLTAKSMKEDMVKGFQIGADDYLTKPFDSEVLLYKLRALLSRKIGDKEEEQNHFEIGRYEYDSEMRILKFGTNERTLSPKEGALLKLLAINKNQLLKRSDALNKIWKDDNYFTGRSMDVYLAKVRKYLSDDPKVSIINVHSEGFRLVDET
ncbi:MAG: DNA-binding response OmpR family regulator [Roseivirga sp.]|jgi:two-component system OmpR family response regulator